LGRWIGADVHPAPAPTTDVFPAARGDLTRFELTPGEVERFERDGFVSGLDVLDARAVEELRARLGELGRRLPELREQLYEVEHAWLASPDEVVLHFLGAWLVDEWFHDLVFHPRVTVPLAQLLGARRLRFWHDQVFWKPAGHAGVVPWHQDYSYWTRTTPARHITMFVALDDMSATNGGLEYVPGSHRWPLLPRVDFGGPRRQLDAHLAPEQRAAFTPTQVELRAGQASVHHSHTVHGSAANASDGPRRAIVLNYMDADTRSADDAPLLAGTAAIPRGARVEGPHFPIVLERG
jgi:ectoine hydroxylase-related dioxygenase (phytanoyl-CoA dioxygenase family)